MELTKIERAMLVNQYSILAILDNDNSSEYLKKAEIVSNGYEGFYDELFDNISDGISVAICEETHKILSMYRVINNCISNLTQEQKDNINLDYIKFDGFDANDGNHFVIMKFLVEVANLFEEHQNSNFNSHSMASLRRYRQILPIYNQVMKENNYRLNWEGFQKILGHVIPTH